MGDRRNNNNSEFLLGAIIHRPAARKRERKWEIEERERERVKDRVRPTIPSR